MGILRSVMMRMRGMRLRTELFKLLQKLSLEYLIIIWYFKFA